MSRTRWRGEVILAADVLRNAAQGNAAVAAWINGSSSAIQRLLGRIFPPPTSRRSGTPEFFGNMIMVNGNTWPYQVVEQRRYRLRFLNGCDSRFLILDFNQIPGVEVWQIGNEGGFLPTPVNISADHRNRLLMGVAERADVIVDFTNVPVGNYVLANVGPDAPRRRIP